MKRVPDIVMQSVKGKILLIYALLAVAVISLAGYSWYNTGVISARVEAISQPDSTSAHLKDIATNISRITNLYLKRSESKIDDKQHQLLINEINNSLDALVEQYNPDNQELVAELDSIPLLLDSITNAYQEIRLLRKRFNEDVRGRIGNEIMSSLATAQLTDSVYVQNNYQREVIQIVEKELLQEIPDEETIDRRNFFQRLFSGNKIEEEIVEEQPDSLENMIEAAEAFRFTEVGSDTLTQSAQDTLVTASSNVQIFKDEVAKILRREQAMANQIEEKEAYLYNINLFVIGKLETIINRFQRDREEELRNTTQATLAASRNFNEKLTYIVFGFAIAGLVVLWMLLRDVEKNRYYQKLLVRNEQQARLRAEEKQRFLSTMSHELRTPLTSIIGYTELMKEDDNPHIKAVHASATYLLQIANDILDIAKIEAGKIDVNPTPVDLTGILREIELKFAPIIENAGLKAEFDIPQKPVYIETDALRLQQVFYNLLHNAIKFTTSGFVKFKTQVEEVAGDAVIVTVRIIDTGIGIDKREQENIFKDYQQAGTHKDNIKGTGLGLGIVKQIVMRLNGQISVDSEPGKGSTFMVSFNAKRASLVEEEVPETVAVPGDVLKGYHIFVLDDDLFITRLYQLILSQYGARVTSENDPLKAVPVLKNQIPDILITDIKMPGLSGIQVVQELEKVGCLPDKIVVASANVFFEEENLADSPLFDAVLQKPFTQEKLLQLLVEILELQSSVEVFSENGTATVADEEHPALDLSDLKKYTMGDAGFLKELLNNLYVENEKELEIMKQNLEQQNWTGAADNIHKLISRFGQIKVTVSVDARNIESRLRRGESGAAPQAEKLLSEWKQYNQHIEQMLSAEVS